jgi:hypothetical protein
MVRIVIEGVAYTFCLMNECREGGRGSELKEAYMPEWDDELPDGEE